MWAAGAYESGLTFAGCSIALALFTLRAIRVCYGRPEVLANGSGAQGG